ncbi:hypothetical protein N7G274_007473 [Stereocaulon virgatum]|uniref:Nab2-like CCCH zinc finger domain-containing protein n=1 Tax=Stereocaulon virgatum TaxID=373712 RepID=A0ABR4A0Y1_9LECA
MAVEVSLNTPLAEALSNVVQPKLAEVGWSTGHDDSALGEYIILMLVNGKTQEQIAAELSNDLLNLPPEDTGATDFAKWLFEQVDVLNSQLNGVPQPQTQQNQTIPPYQGERRNSRGQLNDGDAEMEETLDGAQIGAIPTGPKSMRNTSRNGNKRMIGQISRAMDRSTDAALHRVRPQQGTERINTHNRQPPKGPRNSQNQPPRTQPNGRPMGLGNGPMPSKGTGAPLMQMTPQQQMQLMAMYEEQARMFSQIFSPQQQQNLMPGMAPPGVNAGFLGPNQQPGRSLFERVEGASQRQNGHFVKRPQKNGGGFQLPTKHDDTFSSATSGDISSSMEVESSQNPTEPSPETICKFNLKCTKQDCPYAHQSPVAPPGTTIDVNDVCPFGAACKNRKCVGRHPSPAQKVGHQSEQDCKFFPNCVNPKCPFRHPTMPMCRNGADCNREGCMFTHVRTMCKFNPCLNADCPYKHAEGQQRGKFGDKVWTAEGGEKEHVSERKFIDDEMAEEELIVPNLNVEDIKAKGRDHGSESSMGTEVVT